MMQENENKKQETESTNDYTEQYKGIICLRKGQFDEKDIWFATVGRQLISDGAFDTKEELIENIENVTLDRVTKIAAGIFGRMMDLNNENHES